MHASCDFPDPLRREPPMYCYLGEEVTSICAQDADCSSTRFLAATNKPEGRNKVFSIENCGDGTLLTQAVDHPFGAITHISCCPLDGNLYATTYIKVASKEKCSTHAQVWKKKGHFAEPVANPANSATERIVCTEWEPNDGIDLLLTTRDRLIVWDSKEMSDKANMDCMHSPTMGRWDSLSGGRSVGVGYDGSLALYDLRNGKQVQVFPEAHRPILRNFDFNPTRVNEVATCGDDGAARVWDSRNPSRALSTLETQSHWVWTVRYNPTYENLMVTGGSDSTVRLYFIPAQKLSKGTKPDERRYDPLVRIYDEHEDSVYAVEWSQSDSWYFASVSFDGSLMINRVPADDQINTLLHSESSADEQDENCT